MIVAGLRRMTVSVNGARWLAFCSSVVSFARHVQGTSGFIAFPDCFVAAAGFVGIGHGESSLDGAADPAGA
jgi:hypothetical protein